MFGQKQTTRETIMEMKLNFHSYKSEFIVHSYATPTELNILGG